MSVNGMTGTNGSAVVVLVPGVGFGGLEMVPLARRLAERGYETRVFWHSPWRRHPSESARALYRMAASLEADTIHFVGHSMGGIIAVRMLAEHPWTRPGRVVTLASPHRGFRAVRRISGLPGGRWLAGEGPLAACMPDRAALPPNRELGSLAGNLNLVFGALLVPGDACDTLVSVQETIRPDMRDHAVLPFTHASMLVSRRVAEHVEHFLRRGAFPK